MNAVVCLMGVTVNSRLVLFKCNLVLCQMSCFFLQAAVSTYFRNKICCRHKWHIGEIMTYHSTLWLGLTTCARKSTYPVITFIPDTSAHFIRPEQTWPSRNYNINNSDYMDWPAWLSRHFEADVIITLTWNSSLRLGPTIANIWPT